VFVKEQIKNSVTWPRIRMDMNADYLMFGGPAREDRAFIIEAEIPYAAYAAVSTYTNGLEGIPYAALNGVDWVPDSGDMADNPWTTGSVVNSPLASRKVTVVVTPKKHYQTAKDLGFENVVAVAPPFPPIPPSFELPTLGEERFGELMIFVWRTYLPERFDPNSSPTNPTAFNTDSDFDRRGYVKVPKIRAVSATDLTTPRACPVTADETFEELINFIQNFGTASPEPFLMDPLGEFITADDDGFYDPVGGEPFNPGNFGNPPNVPGKLSFYRLPIPLIQYPGAGGTAPDGTDPTDKLLDCTGYLSAGLYEPGQINMVGFKKQPSFFDNSMLMPGDTTTYERGNVLYYSLGAFGAKTLTINDNAMIPDFGTLHTTDAGDLSTVYITLPDRIFFGDTATDRADKELIANWAEANNFNVMPSSTGDSAFVPVLIYRNKGNNPNTGIDCRTQTPAEGEYCNLRKSVPCYSTLETTPDGTVVEPFRFRRWSEAPEDPYAASPANMRDYAPQGLPCPSPTPEPLTQQYLDACLVDLVGMFE